MGAYSVTIRRLGVPPQPYFDIGSTSAAVAEKAAHRHGACGITVTPLTRKGSTMAHARQEARRPGINKIFDELQKTFPKKPASEIATMAKLEWNDRFGSGSAAAVAALESLKAEVAKSGALFIHGPSGCGKTRYATALCQFFGKRIAVDYDNDTDRGPGNYDSDMIVFSQIALPGSMPFSTAMASAGIAA